MHQSESKSWNIISEKFDADLADKEHKYSKIDNTR